MKRECSVKFYVAFSFHFIRELFQLHSVLFSESYSHSIVPIALVFFNPCRHRSCSIIIAQITQKQIPFWLKVKHFYLKNNIFTPVTLFLLKLFYVLGDLFFFLIFMQKLFTHHIYYPVICYS